MHRLGFQSIETNFTCVNKQNAQKEYECESVSLFFLCSDLIPIQNKASLRWVTSAVRQAGLSHYISQASILKT